MKYSWPNLGLAYQQGQGVKQDQVEAYAWYELAARSLAIAVKKREALEKQMSSQQVLAAQKRAKEFRAAIEAKLKGGGE